MFEAPPSVATMTCCGLSGFVRLLGTVMRISLSDQNATVGERPPNVTEPRYVLCVGPKLLPMMRRISPQPAPLLGLEAGSNEEMAGTPAVGVGVTVGVAVVVGVKVGVAEGSGVGV